MGSTGFPNTHAYLCFLVCEKHSRASLISAFMRHARFSSTSSIFSDRCVMTLPSLPRLACLTVLRFLLLLGAALS